jgi:hypothetical protein
MLLRRGQGWFREILTGEFHFENVDGICEGLHDAGYGRVTTVFVLSFRIHMPGN